MRGSVPVLESQNQIKVFLSYLDGFLALFCLQMEKIGRDSARQSGLVGDDSHLCRHSG